MHKGKYNTGASLFYFILSCFQKQDSSRGRNIQYIPYFFIICIVIIITVSANKYVIKLNDTKNMNKLITNQI